MLEHSLRHSCIRVSIAHVKQYAIKDTMFLVSVIYSHQHHLKLVPVTVHGLAQSISVKTCRICNPRENQRPHCKCLVAEPCGRRAGQGSRIFLVITGGLSFYANVPRSLTCSRKMRHRLLLWTRLCAICIEMSSESRPQAYMNFY